MFLRNVATPRLIYLWRFASGAFNFDGLSFPNLERCSFNSLDLRSYDFLPCSKLESLNLYSCGLDFVDLSKIPQSVTSFSCQGNRIADTTPIVERFGDGAKVDGQFSNMSAEPNWGIHVIDDECANGYLMPGASVFNTLTPIFLLWISVAGFPRIAWRGLVLHLLFGRIKRFLGGFMQTG